MTAIHDVSKCKSRFDITICRVTYQGRVSYNVPDALGVHLQLCWIANQVPRSTWRSVGTLRLMQTGDEEGETMRLGMEDFNPAWRPHAGGYAEALASS